MPRSATASGDGFANIGDDGLGARLRSGVDACDHPGLAKFRSLLDDWERLGQQDRKVLIARGMRLAATFDAPAAAPPKKKRRATQEPELKTSVPTRRPSERASPLAGAARDGAAAQAGHGGGRPEPTADAQDGPPAQVCRGEARPVPPGGAPRRRNAAEGAALAEALPDEAAARGPPPSIESLKGVGPATAKKLAAKGLHTIVDLAFVLPSRYEDRRHRKPIDELQDGDLAVIEGTGGALRQGFGRGRFMASLQIRVPQEDGSSRTVTARWFHRVGGLNKFSQGQAVLAVGPVRWYKGALTMAHPELREPGEPGPAVAVRYPAVEGVAPRTLSRVVRGAVQRLLQPDSGFVDALPPELARRHALPTQVQALAALHLPEDDTPREAVEALERGSSPAHRRLAFDEFFFFQLALLLDRAHLRGRVAHVRPDPDAFDRERIRACLPFEPTGAQWRVLDELAADLGEGRPMLRLLQGDVGSGKTAVAFASAVSIARSGAQTALMAPTEILAEQHLRTLAPWCEAAGLKLALLTGATPKAARTSLLAMLAAGNIDLLIGTHALLTADVHFAELGLVVVDEQHRFGVHQRAILRRKGTIPHLLVMTATPIPRTMALTAYGQLEVSVIDELPPGRTPPSTSLHTGKRGLGRARAEVARHVNKGQRAFVVCPLVEASDALEVTDVEATAAAFRELLPDKRVAVIHGRLSSKDKDAIMAGFRVGETDVLVATTVIEVGVDVPAATVMMVEHAERFGLAQLHQLRGRVGRGGGASVCLLHTGHGPKSDVAGRLSILTETSDGFVVAERDLELRGPGEMLGTRQAGAPRLRFAGFAGEGTKLLVAARDAARDLLESDPDLSLHPEVKAELQRRRADDAAITADAG